MDAILLCLKKRKIRFFRKIKFPNTSIIRFYTKQDFLKLLRIRRNEYDNVLIMAHGARNCILTTTRDLNHQYIPYITIKDAYAFKNNFVFAISCSTANEFGKCCVNLGAIAYLGYQVEIGCLFSSYSDDYENLPRRIATAVDTIIKHIFIEELSRAYEEFLMTPINVRTLRERFSFLLEKRIAQLTSLSTTQLLRQYNVKFYDHEYKKFVVELVLRVLSYLDNILPQLVCIGDENYISSSYMKYRMQDGATKEELVNELVNNYAFQALSHKNYKQYLLNLADQLYKEEKNNA